MFHWVSKLINMRRKKVKDRAYERESFEASVKMQRHAQAIMEARLRALAIKVKNEGRLR